VGSLLHLRPARQPLQLSLITLCLDLVVLARSLPASAPILQILLLLSASHLHSPLPLAIPLLLAPASTPAQNISQTASRSPLETSLWCHGQDDDSRTNSASLHSHTSLVQSAVN